MNIQVVHHQHQGLPGEDFIHEFADQQRPIDPSVAIDDLHQSETEQWSEHHEQIGDTVLLLLEVIPGGLSFAARQ